MPEKDIEIDKLALQQNNYQWQLSCINNADSKAGFLITINLGLIGFAITQIDKILEISSSSSKISTWAIVFLISLTVSTMLSLYFASKAIWPRFSEDRSSIFYFKSIYSKSKEQYSKEVEQADCSAILDDLNGQVWELSKIALKKYANVRVGFRIYGISILFLLAIYINRGLNG